MGFKFRKSYKIAPGVKLNISKRGAGVSVGGKYGGMSVNTNSGARVRASAPGTGISYSTKVGGTSSRKASSKNKSKNKNGCLTSFLVFVLIIMLLGSCVGGNNQQTESQENYTNPTIEKIETTEETFIEDKYIIVDSFIESYNAAYPDLTISNIQEVAVSDKESNLYRSEFRLSAFQDAMSKYGTIGNSEILIVNYGSMELDGLRIYITCESLEDSTLEFFNVLPLLYPDVSEKEISDIQGYIDRWGDYRAIVGNWSVYILKNSSDEGGYTVFFDDSLYTKRKD